MTIDSLRIVLAQLNLVVGDIEGNLKKHIVAASTARDKLSADIIVFPELSLTGYPPEDLLLRKSFVEDANHALKKLQEEIHDIYCVVGYPEPFTHGLYNACALLYNGNILNKYAKRRLPNYGVFDEARYFKPGNTSCILQIKNIPVGLIICEDLWTPQAVAEAKKEGAKLFLSPNASPFEKQKHEARLTVLKKRAQETENPIVYVNCVGGQDELIFDGGSMVVDAKGELCQFAGFFKENLLAVDLKIENEIKIPKAQTNIANPISRIYEGLKLSLKDYIEKNKLPGVLLGLSGGIDSALTLVIAIDALGKDRVHPVIMPSRYTADISIEDATLLANNLNVKTQTFSIEPIYKEILASFTKTFANNKADITEENIQARCRAIILMALSNKFGDLVLTTGNKSELAVGYCTLYGDMAGGFAPLKDLPKTLVYELARYRNSIKADIPQRILERAPSAELAFDQKDEDSLPPYEILDKILACYIDKGQNLTEIIEQGFDPAIAEKVINLIVKNEYKRRQAAIGPRINHRSFGKDWRYPITDGYKVKK